MVKTYFAVTAVVMFKGKMLVLKKSPEDWNYPEHWSFCSGYVKEFEAGEDTCLREIKEETGLDGEIVKRGDIVFKNDPDVDKNWAVLPFLCKVGSDNVKLDHENTDFKWITKEELNDFKFVPGVVEDLKSVGLL